MLPEAFEKVLIERFWLNKIKKKKIEKSRSRKKHCLNNGNVREKWAKRTK